MKAKGWAKVDNWCMFLSGSCLQLQDFRPSVLVFIYNLVRINFVITSYTFTVNREQNLSWFNNIIDNWQLFFLHFSIWKWDFENNKSPVSVKNHIL